MLLAYKCHPKHNIMINYSSSFIINSFISLFYSLKAITIVRAHRK